MHKDQRLSNKLSGSNWTQIGLKMCLNTDSLLLEQTDSPGAKSSSWRSDLLFKCYEIFVVVSGLSHEPNTSNRAQNGLRTGEKQTPDWFGWEMTVIYVHRTIITVS